jgi:hypothetical protein
MIAVRWLEARAMTMMMRPLVEIEKRQDWCADGRRATRIEDDAVVDVVFRLAGRGKVVSSAEQRGGLRPPLNRSGIRVSRCPTELYCTGRC